MPFEATAPTSVTSRRTGKGGLLARREVSADPSRPSSYVSMTELPLQKPGPLCNVHHVDGYLAGRSRSA
jgi:hypothetical protein